MEISAKVYAVAESKALLAEVAEILDQRIYGGLFETNVLEPCEVLPLSKTWYGFAEEEDMTDDPEEWAESLRECARILRNAGAVAVRFYSVDHPDDYQQCICTTPSGIHESGKPWSFSPYKLAMGNQDISIAIDELVSGRSPEERREACWKLARRKTLRNRAGDFEITADGVLKKYHGIGEEDVVIPDAVRVIGDSAFVDLKGIEGMLMDDEDYDAPDMVTLTIPDGVEKIESYAFAYCLFLETVTMADSVRFIGDRAFEGCENLTSIRLSSGLTEIADNTFFACDNLESIVIPEGVTRIQENAFFTCPSLKKVVLPESLVSIGKNAFDACINLKQIKIPKNVKEIAPDAFPKETKIVR